MMLIEMFCLDFLLKDFLYFYLYCVKKKYKENLFWDFDCFENNI